MREWLSERDAALRARLDRFNPWCSRYGLARSLIALAGLLTLLTNSHELLFRPSAEIPDFPPLCEGMSELSLYCIGGDGWLELKRWVAISLYALIISGWRPKITGLLHWWLVISYQITTPSVEGGDQVALLMTMLLIPITLLDPRKNHWDPPVEQRLIESVYYRRLAAAVVYLLLRAQVMVIYLHAAIGKCSGESWLDGSGLWYWLNHPLFGAPSWLMPLVEPLLFHPISVALLTWSPIVLELLLAMALFMPRWGQRVMLTLGLLMHVAFALCFGLISFSTVMAGALILYLGALSEPVRALEVLAKRQASEAPAPSAR